MDDANAPSLLSLPYLASSPDSAIYARTRAWLWRDHNPWFFRSTAGEGIGGARRQDMIWPMSQIMYALTSTSDREIRAVLGKVKRSTAGTGFIHESYDKDNAARFTRPWFAWANTLFGEVISTLATTRPAILQT